VGSLLVQQVFLQFLLEGGQRPVRAELKREGVPDGRIVVVELVSLVFGFLVPCVLMGIWDVVLLLL
jgi:hypothetical protein